MLPTIEPWKLQVPDFEVAARAKSTYFKDRSWKIKAKLKNDTEDAVGASTFDIAGVGKTTTRLDPGERWSMNTYNSHVWSIVNPESEEEILRNLESKHILGIASIRFVEPGQLNVQEIFAAQGSSTKAHQSAQGKAHNSIEDDETIQEGQDDSVMEGLGHTYHKHQIEGWRVWFQDGVEEKNPGLRDRLVRDLQEFNRVYPPKCLEVLQETVLWGHQSRTRPRQRDIDLSAAPIDQKKSGFWFNEERTFEGDAGPKHGMVTHFSRGWLRGKGPEIWVGDNPNKCYCVESYRARDYAKDNGIFKAVVVHELSHAYHAITSREGTDNIIAKAYEKGVGAGFYDNGEYNGKPIKEGTHWTGKLNRRPYAAKNKYEYWAEANASFFSSNRFRNGFYPYVHAELKGFDPYAYKMIEDVLGIQGDELASRGEVPYDWLAKFSKIDYREARKAFKLADADSSGNLDQEEFCSCIESLGIEGLTNEEVCGLVQFADANKDGKVDPEEVFTWLASYTGKMHVGKISPDLNGDEKTLLVTLDAEQASCAALRRNLENVTRDWGTM
eukprot:s1157_g13.t1